MLTDVCIPNDNYDIKRNPKVREKYPNLYREVSDHDKLTPRNSWYSLSEEAYREYLVYVDDDEIGYVG